MARIVQPSVAHGGIFMLLAVFSRHRRSIRPPELRGRLTGRGRGQTGLVLQGLLRNAPSPLVRAISSIGMGGEGPAHPGDLAVWQGLIMRFGVESGHVRAGDVAKAQG